MNEFGFDPMLEYKLRRQGLLKEAARSSLLKEASQKPSFRSRASSRVLVAVGRKLARLGTHLEEYYAVPVETSKLLNQPSGRRLIESGQR